jgi:hypothetical protein
VSRDFDQIQRAAQAQAETVAQDNTLSLPPAYIQGFEITLRKDYTVMITGGSANVGGRQVTLSLDHQLTLQDWVAPRMDTPQHYYIYLSKDGNIYVDIIKPKFDSYYGYYQQPDTGWRVIGKLFVQNTNIIYAIKDVSRSGRTVTVAPKDYIGYADYYCDGKSDEILINAAIQYEWSAYQGGMVQLLEGKFHINSAINLLSYISLVGLGDGTVLEKNISSGYEISISGTSSVNILGVKIQNIKLTRNSLDVIPNSIYSTYANDLILQDVTIEGMLGNTVYCQDDLGVSIINLVIDSKNGNSEAGITVWNDNVDCQYLNIKNCTIRNTSSTTFAKGISCIVTGGHTCRSQILDNNIYNLTGSLAIVTNYGIEINDSNSQISNNRIYNIKNSAAATKVNGIGIVGGTSNSVSSNYCINNGSDTDVANTNGNNYYDGGTSTQCFSNSWQAVSGTKEVAYTPTFTALGTSPSSINFFWSRSGNRVKVMGKFTAGAVPSATEARISLPSLSATLISDSTLIPSIQVCGVFGCNATNLDMYCLIESGVGYITISNIVDGFLTKNTGSAHISGGGVCSLQFEIPIQGWNV